MEKRELICIGCPMGCMLTVHMDENNVIKVDGNLCKQGDLYARREVTNPTRIITTTVKVTNKKHEMLSVKTEKDIPKEKITQCLQSLKNVSVKAPIRIGDVIIENIADTGVSIVATKNVSI
jgi:CxxC motif-containing protein